MATPLTQNKFDVLGEPDHPIKPAGNNFLNLLFQLKCTTESIKTGICNSLGKTCFGDIKITDIYGRGNSKVSKQFVTDKLFEVLELSDQIISDAGPSMLSSCTPAPLKNCDINSVEDKFLQDLSVLVANKLQTFESNVPSENTQQKTVTTRSKIKIDNPTKPLYDLEENFIDESLSKELVSLFDILV